MKRSIFPLILFLTVVAAAPGRTADWRDRFGQFVSFAATPAPSGSHHTHRTFRRGRVVYYAPRPATGASLPSAEVELDGKQLNAPSFIRQGRTFVGLRDLLHEFEVRWGMRFEIDYRGGDRVSVRRLDQGAAPTAEQEFGKGIAAMWNGKTVEALQSFERAEALEGPFAEDAQELAQWLRSGSEDPGSEIGIIRVAWWKLPEDVEVFVDDELIVRGAPILKAAVGIHTLRLAEPDGKQLVEKRFRVKPNEPFVIQFGAAESAAPTSTGNMPGSDGNAEMK